MPLQIEHIHPGAKGGSDRVSNLASACEKCNLKKGTQDIKTFLLGKPDLVAVILKQAKVPLKDAAAANSSQWKLFKTLKTLGLLVTIGTGGQTKFNRTRFGLPKEHWRCRLCWRL